jgi:hypothetical protein
MVESDGRFPASPNGQDYSQLTDEQLHSAIRFAEKRLHWNEEDHAVLLSAYRDEIAAMRRHLIDRALARLLANDSAASPEQHRELRRAIAECGVGENEVARMIRLLTNGRTDRVEDLREIEVMALHVRLERES